VVTGGLASASTIVQTDWPSAGAIRERDTNLVVLPRQPPAWIGDALDALADVDLPKIELDGPVCAVGARADLAMAVQLPATIGSWLGADVRVLLAGWAQVTGEVSCHLCLEAVGSDACRKFHTDMVRIRLLCTYRGPGSEWVPDDHVRRAHLGPHGENEDIVPDATAIRRVPRFAAALLKGDAYDPHTPGIVHRSPPLIDGAAARLLLRIDGRR